MCFFSFFYMYSNSFNKKKKKKLYIQKKWKLLDTWIQRCVSALILQSAAVSVRACVHPCVQLDISNRPHSEPSVHTAASRPRSAATFLMNNNQIFTQSHKAKKKKIRHLFIWITEDFALPLLKPQIPKSIWIKVFDYQFPSNPRLQPSVASADIRWACAAASGEEFRRTFSFLRRP